MWVSQAAPVAYGGAAEACLSCELLTSDLQLLPLVCRRATWRSCFGVASALLIWGAMKHDASYPCQSPSHQTRFSPIKLVRGQWSRVFCKSGFNSSVCRKSFSLVLVVMRISAIIMSKACLTAVLCSAARADSVTAVFSGVSTLQTFHQTCLDKSMLTLIVSPSVKAALHLLCTCLWKSVYFTLLSKNSQNDLSLSSIEAQLHTPGQATYPSSSAIKRTQMQR